MAIRQGVWKLIALQVNSGQPQYELYRLDSDLGEHNNVAHKHPKVVRRLSKLMQQMHQPSAEFPFKSEVK